MRIDFEEQTHTYSVNGDIASISITELLRKHGLAPDYSNVDEEVLERARTKGKEAHKDLENVLNNASYVPTTEQGKAFAEWVDKNVQCGVGEQLLGYDYNGMIIAGTADVMGFLNDNTPFIADHKTQKSIHKESVTWQVNLYDYFARKLDGEKINGNPINWKGTQKFYCFQYNEDGMKVHELDKIPDSEIEKLLDAEANNEIYQRPSLVIEDELRIAIECAEQNLMFIQEQEKIAKEKAEELRAKLVEQMEKQGIKSWESEKLKITYIAPQDRLSIDSAKVKKNFPQVYEQCQKISKVKATVRVTIREQDNEQL